LADVNVIGSVELQGGKSPSSIMSDCRNVRRFVDELSTEEGLLRIDVIKDTASSYFDVYESAWLSSSDSTSGCNPNWIFPFSLPPENDLLLLSLCGDDEGVGYDAKTLFLFLFLSRVGVFKTGTVVAGGFLLPLTRLPADLLFLTPGNLGLGGDVNIVMGVEGGVETSDVERESRVIPWITSLESDGDWIRKWGTRIKSSSLSNSFPVHKTSSSSDEDSSKVSRLSTDDSEGNTEKEEPDKLEGGDVTLTLWVATIVVMIK